MLFLIPSEYYLNPDYTEEEKQRAQEEINSQRQREFEVTNAAFQQQQDGMDRCRELLQIFNEQNEALKKGKQLQF